MTDRGFWLGLGTARLNVRRLMYQSLILPAVLRNDACRLRASFHPEDLERLPDTLVDRVRRYSELRRDLLRIEMLVNEAQAIELRGGQPSDARRHQVIGHLPRSRLVIIRQAVRIFQRSPHRAQHGAYSRATSLEDLRSSARILPDFQQISGESGEIWLMVLNWLGGVEEECAQCAPGLAFL
ncbi:MAG TPA: hypothetical protein VLM36_03185 [Sphingomicrobium sp.]|nr:hypothetical protein [Sphingomicrobium sp.]